MPLERHSVTVFFCFSMSTVPGQCNDWGFFYSSCFSSLDVFAHKNTDTFANINRSRSKAKVDISTHFLSLSERRLHGRYE